jgi:hypothetical protein
MGDVKNEAHERLAEYIASALGSESRWTVAEEQIDGTVLVISVFEESEVVLTANGSLTLPENLEAVTSWVAGAVAANGISATEIPGAEAVVTDKSWGGAVAAIREGYRLGLEHGIAVPC